ncbi:hypothetical protein FQZ97_1091900 [compost metagenome]
MMAGFSFGTSMSSTAIEIPARVARRKPFCSSLSAKTTVSFRPHLRKDTLISLEISFFFSGLFSTSKGRPLGRISDSSARPTVVSTREMKGVNSPVALSSVYCCRRTLILAVISTAPLSSARCSSSRSAKIMPSPLPLMRSRVA